MTQGVRQNPWKQAIRTQSLWDRGKTGVRKWTPRHVLKAHNCYALQGMGEQGAQWRR